MAARLTDLPAGVTLRPTQPEHRPLLLELYAATRVDELAPVPWTDDEKRAFVEMQFDAQDKAYRMAYPDGEFLVVEIEGVPCGRLYLGRLPGELRLIDIIVEPAWRGHGIGKGLVDWVIARAEAERRDVTLHVEPWNPAKRLYERLGFETIELRGIYEFMRRPHALSDLSFDDEYVDIYDDDGDHLGQYGRRAAHRNGTWHRCFHCVVVAQRPDGPQLTLQRRGLSLDEYAGQIDVTVAGHLRAGESVIEAAAREFREELGVDLSIDRLEPIGEYPLIVRRDPIFARERTDVFLLRDERSPAEFRPDPHEVHSLISIGVADASRLWLGQILTAAAIEHRDGQMSQRAVTLDDFVNEVPDYWGWLAHELS